MQLTPTSGRRLHVVLVSNTDGGPWVTGADRDWVNLLNALGPDHLRVTWVGSRGSDELRKYVDERVLTRTVDLPHPLFWAVVPDNAYTERSRWLWTKIVARAALGAGRASLRLRRVLRRDPADVVLTNTVVPLLGASFALLARRPHVWNVKEYLDPRVRACRRYAALVTRCSSAVVVPSRPTGDAFDARLHVLPDGGDLEEIASRVRSGRADVLGALGLPPDRPVVAHVGAISERKGQHLTAEAFVELASRGGPPACSLVFLGTGSESERGRVERILARAPVDWREAVRFDVSRDGDLSALAAADVVVHPSTYRDAFPNVIREAMTLGKPVIATALGGMVEMVVDGENGLLVPHDDAGALASALERLLRSAELRERFGVSAAAFAREEFDVHVRKRAFLELLNDLAGRNGRGPA